MIVYVDFDSVVGDLMTPLLNQYNHDYNDNLTIEDITDWHLHQFVKCGEKIYDYITPELYQQVLPIKGAISAIKNLQESHRVVFATAGAPATAQAKIDWLIRYGLMEEGVTYPNFINLKDKSLLKGDVLIDDGLHNLEAFDGEKIVFDQPWNRKDHQWDRALNWDEVLDLITDIAREKTPAPPHYTEITRPVQCQAFRELLDRMYQIHLAKNADYSPANILGPGEVGVVTRIWDKAARLMNLSGFRFEVTQGVFEKPLQPQNEALDDTYLDLANYAMIGYLLRKGKWGH